MPVATNASAVSRTSVSSISAWNLFHEFQPIGGVGASPSLSFPRPMARDSAGEPKAWRRTTYVVAATELFVLAGFGLALPFQQLGVTDAPSVAWWTGVMSAASGFTMAAATPIWGAVGDRFGWKTMLVRAIVGGGLVLVAMGLVGSVGQLLALRFLQGAFSGTVAAAATLVATIAPREETGYAVGVVSASIQVGNFVGPLLGGITLVTLGFRGSFGLSGVVLLCCAVAASVWVSEAPASRATATMQRASLRAALAPIGAAFAAFGWPQLRGVVLAQFATQLTFSATLALFPLYAQTITRPPWLSIELAIGAAFAATALSSAAATPLLGRLAVRRVARRADARLGDRAAPRCCDRRGRGTDVALRRGRCADNRARAGDPSRAQVVPRKVTRRVFASSSPRMSLRSANLS